MLWGENRGKWKGRPNPGHLWLEPPVLCHWATEPDNHQPKQSSECTAQVVLNALAAHLTRAQVEVYSELSFSHQNIYFPAWGKMLWAHVSCNIEMTFFEKSTGSRVAQELLCSASWTRFQEWATHPDVMYNAFFMDAWYNQGILCDDNMEISSSRNKSESPLPVLPFTNSHTVLMSLSSTPRSPGG